jgi:DNA-binding GntR family transcriptional regulator
MKDGGAEAAQTSLADEACRALLDDILSARLPGGTIVQERRLAMRLGISRSPMRDALGRLQGQGLLVQNSKGALSVRVITLRDYLDSLAVRQLVEPTAAALACMALEPGQLRALVERFATIEADADADHAEIRQFDDALHDSIAQTSGNPFIAETIVRMRRYTTMFERQTKLGRGDAARDELRGILRALENRDAEAARAAMARHLDSTRRSVLGTY